MSLFSTPMKGSHGCGGGGGGEERPAILPKMKGSGIMVSDFVEEYGGFLKLTNEAFKHAKENDPTMVQEARQLLEYGVEKDGY